jgi:hypothetical protein
MHQRGSDQDVAEVRALGDAYCAALWASDVDTLRDMFHARANLYGSGSDGLEEYTVEAWLDMVAARPAAEGVSSHEVLHASCPAPDLGIVTLDAAARDREFTDTLSFVKLNGTWRVVAKTFHLRARGEA